jgi:F-type H+-transporting ATPase subunit gamma
MASLRHIRRRIRSIQSTKQIMRAMQLVSGSKFKRAQTRLLQSRQMMGFLDDLLQRVLVAAARRHPERAKASRGTAAGRGRRVATHLDHPLMAAREEAPSALLLVTSDAGLAGAYNTNLIQLAEGELRREGARATQVSYVGKRGYRHFAKRGYAAKDAVLDLAGRPDVARIDAIGKTLMDRFLAGEIGSVRVLYAKFISASVSRPTIAQWLPIQLERTSSPQTNRPTGQRANGPTVDYIFEPSPERVFADLLPRWAIATFRLLLLEAFTSEHGARMIAMKNATDNAQELLGSLTLQRNKIRQATITRELSEIVGTVEALK